MAISTTDEIIADFKTGKMVILIDEEDRENEGDLVLAADFVTAEAINFMVKYGRGLVCLTLTEERCHQLQLPMMVSANYSAHGTNFINANGFCRNVFRFLRSILFPLAKLASPNFTVPFPCDASDRLIISSYFQLFK